MSILRASTALTVLLFPDVAARADDLPPGGHPEAFGAPARLSIAPRTRR